MPARKILIVSDSHGYEAGLKRLLLKIEEMEEKPDCIFHLGDFVFDGTFLEEESSIPVHAVSGNCDIWGSEEPEDKLFTINGRSILITHGHNYRVKSGLLQLSYYAEENGIDICCFGHTHAMVILKENGRMFLNPGSLMRPRTGKPGYIMLTIDDGGKAQADFYEL
ncbi:MAG: metallophosphoesterase [Clostridiales bacterium]|nr:metallophosphoesterase [Clostridiales bacterium]